MLCFNRKSAPRCIGLSASGLLCSACGQHSTEGGPYMDKELSLPNGLLSLLTNPTVVLLWILQDASMPEIIDVTAEKNQFWISVLWHLAMGRSGILFRRRNHHRFLAWNPFHATLCQGTKSARQPGNGC